MPNFHEDIQREDEVVASSERSFGIIFAVFFLAVGVWPIVRGETIRWWALLLGLLILVVAFVMPRILKYPNRWWLGLGLLLAQVLSPLALGVLFYLVIAPMGLVMRWLGHDPLRLKVNKSFPTYWVDRNPPGPSKDSFPHQF